MPRWLILVVIVLLLAISGLFIYYFFSNKLFDPIHTLGIGHTKALIDEEKEETTIINENFPIDIKVIEDLYDSKIDLNLTPRQAEFPTNA